MESLLSLDIATVFAVVYAIVFGGTLNRLAIFSAFWKDDEGEDFGRWVERFAWSTLWFTFIPGVYFALVVRWIAGLTSPGDLFVRWFGGVVGAFFAVLALNAFYRLWLGIVLWRKVVARKDKLLNQHEGRWPTLERYYRLGHRNYFKGAAVSGGLAILGLFILGLVKYCGR